MCQSYRKSCVCGERTSELFFTGDVCNEAVVNAVYCPNCSRDVSVRQEAVVRDNGWILELDHLALRALAPRMGLESATVTAEQVFDGDFVTWVGFTPEDNVVRSQEREELAQRYAEDKKGHFFALKEWAAQRESKLAAEGWRKARLSQRPR